MELAQYLHVVARRWWTLLLSLLAVLVVTGILTKYQRPVYRAETSLIVMPATSLKDLGGILPALDTLSRGTVILETYKGIATSQTVIDAASKQTGLDENGVKQYAVIADIAQSSNILSLAVDGPDPETVVTFTDQLAQQTMRFAEALYAPYSLRLLDRAAPARLISPKMAQNLLLAAIVGVGLGLILVFLSEYLRRPNDIVVQENIIDPTTGAFTKSYFMQRLNQELARCRRQNYSLSLAVLQIDNLERLKGNRARDLRNQVMRRVAMGLTLRLRSEDMMALVGRDQFAFLFPDVPGRLAAETMKRFQACIESATFELEPPRIRFALGSRSGVSAYEQGLDADELIARAEQALRSGGVNAQSKTNLWQERQVYSSG